MLNPYLPQEVSILNIKRENPQVKLFDLSFVHRKAQEKFHFNPGQFVMVSLPGYGEAPFDICSDSKERKFFQICVRKVGFLTEALHRLRKGSRLGIRGPYGKGFPSSLELKKKNLLLVGGGCGFITFKSILEIASQTSWPKKIQVFYGVALLDDLIFRNYFKVWQEKFDFHITLDKPAKGWRGDVGLITTLFDKYPPVKKARVLLCGPPIMYKFVLKKLKEHKFKDKDIYLALERKMDCGLGVCQHCAVGSKYVCQDGSIFNYSEIKDLPEMF